MHRIIAISLIVLGLFATFFSFNMSITAPGTNIANLSLMAERQNILLVAAVFVLAGVVLFAADHVRGGPALTTPVQRQTWSRLATMALGIAASVRLGFYYENEALVLGPFWAIAAWMVWNASIVKSLPPMRTTVVVFGLALASLIATLMFIDGGGPAYPTLRQMASPGHLFPSDAEMQAARAGWLADKDQWRAEHHETVLLGNVYSLLAVLAGSALLLAFLAARRVVGRYKKVSSRPEQSEPSP
jgi:hypothetical protein